MKQIEEIIKSQITWGLREIADQMKVSIQFLRSEVRKGNLPKVQIGRRVLVTADDLLNYISQRRVGEREEQALSRSDS